MHVSYRPRLLPDEHVALLAPEAKEDAIAVDWGLDEHVHVAADLQRGGIKRRTWIS